MQGTNSYEALHSIVAYSSVHAYLLSHREVARLSVSLGTNPSGSANNNNNNNFADAAPSPNFVRLYSELFKQFDISKYYLVERLLPHLTHPLSILHQYALQFVINRTQNNGTQYL